LLFSAVLAQAYMQAVQTANRGIFICAHAAEFLQVSDILLPEKLPLSLEPSLSPSTFFYEAVLSDFGDFCFLRRFYQIYQCNFPGE
jgi:hypothetical protein